MSHDPAAARRVLEVNRRKTFAIISHPDAGKTTLTGHFAHHVVEDVLTLKRLTADGCEAGHNSPSDWSGSGFWRSKESKRRPSAGAAACVQVRDAPPPVERRAAAIGTRGQPNPLALARRSAPHVTAGRAIATSMDNSSFRGHAAGDPLQASFVRCFALLTPLPASPPLPSPLGEVDAAAQ